VSIAMLEFDPGPPARFAEIFVRLPDYAQYKDCFWYDWGPVFYRGRLNGTARVLCIASDPGPTERVAGRALVGDAGQRVQGFLAKIGLTHSYLCLNAFAYALFPSCGSEGLRILEEDAPLRAWREELFTKAKGRRVKAIVAFGQQAQRAVALWEGVGATPVFRVPHPSSRDDQALLESWGAAVEALRGIIKPDPDAPVSGPNYRLQFEESDYAPIPRRDLPFGVPAWLGDDRWGRMSQPPHRNCVSRPNPDDRHTLIWIAPTS
jgi:uracil-DNA glycosylase